MRRANKIADVNVRVRQQLLGRLRLADLSILVGQARRAALLFEKREVELVSFILRRCRCGSTCQLRSLVGRHDGRLVQDLLVLAQKEKFCAGRRDASSVPLVRGVQDVCLLAEESIALVDNILDYFWTRTPVFNTKR